MRCEGCGGRECGMGRVGALEECSGWDRLYEREGLERRVRSGVRWGRRGGCQS